MVETIQSKPDFPANLRPLLLSLAKRQPPPLHLLRTAPAEWWTELRRHHLYPLLYFRLTQAGLVEALPPAVAQLLKHDYAAALQLYLLQKVATRQILQTLAAAGIEVILLKGADLRLRVYEDPATRPMTDLDLLVSPESVGAVLGLLASHGYTSALDSVHHSPDFQRRFRVEFHLLGPPPVSLMVDLHWELEAVANYYRLPYERLAPRAQTLDWQGVPVRVLCAEHMLLYLFLHYYDEREIALKLVDMALALTRLPLDWNLFLREAAHGRCQAPALIILQGLAELLPGAVPLQVLQELGTYVPRAVERLILRHSLHPLARLLGPLAHQRRPSAWVAYMAALLWPDPAYLTAVQGNPSRLAFLGSSLKFLFPRGG